MKYIKLIEELEAAMKAACLAHIKAGEFIAAYELIRAGNKLRDWDDDEQSAQMWLADYRRK